MIVFAKDALQKLSDVFSLDWTISPQSAIAGVRK
jgi:hypothetical protein